MTGPISVVSCAGGLGQAVGRGQALDRDDLRDDGVHRREEQRVGDAEHDPHHDEMPQLGASGQDEAGKQADGHAAGDVRGEHQATRRDPVGQRAADDDEDGTRDAGRQEHAAQGEAGAGQVEHEPGQRDEVELVAEQRHGLADPDEPEVAQDERSQDGEPGGRGRRHGVHVTPPRSERCPPARRSRRGPGRSRRRRWPRGCGRPSTPTGRGCATARRAPAPAGRAG